MGAPLFSRIYPELHPIYSENRRLFLEIWKNSIAAQKNGSVVWSLGFRGQGDRPFWDDDPKCDTPEKRADLINQVIEDQLALLHEEYAAPVCCINLYGEILELYNMGLLKLPENIIKVWADNGYGKMVSRRQGNHNPRIPSIPTGAGKHGVYYHASFYDLQASNHITMLPNAPELVAKELEEAYQAGAKDYLIVNCGNIRPHTYFLEMLSAFWRNGCLDLCIHNQKYANQYFGNEMQVISLLREYSRHTICYAPHPDERAGEQIYHHPVRQMLAAWMSDKKDISVESLIWLCGNNPLSVQVKHFYSMIKPALAPWDDYLRSCIELKEFLPFAIRNRFQTVVEVQAIIHKSGCEGAKLFCESFFAMQEGQQAKAYCLAWLAMCSYQQGVDAFNLGQNGIWNGFYDNDCLTDIRLTVSMLKDLVAWLRINGEGENAHWWTREYLMPPDEKGVVLLTNVTRPLTDEELAIALTKALHLKRVAP